MPAKHRRIGIGADFDGANDFPEGASDVSMLPNVTYELLKRGYSEGDILGRMGGGVALGFLSKPFTRSALERKLRELLA